MGRNIREFDNATDLRNAWKVCRVCRVIGSVHSIYFLLKVELSILAHCALSWQGGKGSSLKAAHESRGLASHHSKGLLQGTLDYCRASLR